MFLQIPSSFPELANWLFVLISAGLGIYLTIRIQNLATKQDTGDITREIEKVKADFTKQNEELKASLSLTTQHKLTIKKYEIDAIFDYNRKLFDWLYAASTYNPYVYGLEEQKRQTLATNYITEKRNAILQASSVADIMVDDKHFNQKRHEIAQAILAYEDVIHKIGDQIDEYRRDYYYDFGNMHDLETHVEQNNIFQHFTKKKNRLQEEKSKIVKEKDDEMRKKFDEYKLAALQAIKKIEGI